MTDQPIVVGYNGREHSRVALAWAADEAVRHGARLLVVFAANYPGMTLEPGPGLLDPEPGALEAAEEITIRGVSEALAEHPELRVGGATEVTSPARTLIEAADQASMLVLGNRGRGPMTSALLGSVSFTVAAQAPCPVVVVSDDALARPVGPTHRVVVGADGSRESALALAFAAARAAASSAALEVVTATGGHLVPHVDENRLRRAAEAIAQDAADQVRRTHPDLAVTTRVEDSPAENILVDASADAGLVVVGTRGRGAFQGMLLGSVSHAVIHAARCPVAVV